jgi:hypothetical protein
MRRIERIEAVVCGAVIVLLAAAWEIWMRAQGAWPTGFTWLLMAFGLGLAIFGLASRRRSRPPGFDVVPQKKERMAHEGDEK